jgi:LPXTG-motif cell wall-anchored protein
MRKLLSVLSVLVVPLAFAASAHADYPPSAPSAEVASASVVPGGTQTITVQNFCPNVTVTFVLKPGDKALGTAEASADGSATISFQAPSTVGSYSVVATAANDCHPGAAVESGTTTFAVQSAGPIPQTGTDSSSTMLWAGIIAGLGVVLAFGATIRRRRVVVA